MTNNKNSTRYYSGRQEKIIAKTIKGEKTVNSGAGLFSGGDVSSKNWLIECKTVVKKVQSISIKEEWLLKIEEEAFAMGKNNFSLVFNFGDVKNIKNFYIISEDNFIKLKNLLEEEE